MNGRAQAKLMGECEIARRVQEIDILKLRPLSGIYWSTIVAALTTSPRIRRDAAESWIARITAY
jgi:hypothetical protein